MNDLVWDDNDPNDTYTREELYKVLSQLDRARQHLTDNQTKVSGYEKGSAIATSVAIRRAQRRLKNIELLSRIHSTLSKAHQTGVHAESQVVWHESAFRTTIKWMLVLFAIAAFLFTVWLIHFIWLITHGF